MRPRMIIGFSLVLFVAASMQSAPALGSWNTFGTYHAADFYNAHLGLVGTDGQGGMMQRVVDGALTEVFAKPVIQIAIQDSNRAWATDGDSLYLGTKEWSSWRAVLGQTSLTLIHATPVALFVYSNGNMYRTVGDTMLTIVQGIASGDSITAMDYLTASTLIAVSYSNGYNPPSNIYRSTDSGASWTPVLNRIGSSASVFADTAHHLVFVGGDSLRVSSDNGMTWSVISPPEEFGLIALQGQVFGAHDCMGTFYIANGTVNGSNADIFRSRDDGNSFENVGSNPFPPSFGSSMKGWAFDRGSTVILGFLEFIGSDLDLDISHDGVDGLIPDSVRSAITVSADTIYDTICAVPSVLFHVSVASSLCTGITIDAISVIKTSGNISKTITPHTLFNNDTSFQFSYSGKKAGIDSIVLRVLFHSVEWGFEEHVDVPVLAYSVAPPAILIASDSLQFGDVRVTRTKQLPLVITNAGCSPLFIDSIVSSNGALFAVSVVPRLIFPLTIKGGTTDNINIIYSPVTPGPSIESLELGTSAGHTFIELEGIGTTTAQELDSEAAPQVTFSIFPNPAASMIFVRGVDEHAPYELTDLLGRRVLNGFLDAQSIDVSSLTEGMYLLRSGAHFSRILISGK
jgi:hypothetical protein